MRGETLSDERERVADALRRIRDGVQERALLETAPREAPAVPALRSPDAPGREPDPVPPPPPARPDGTGVNNLWQAQPTRESGGALGALARFLRRVLGPTLEAQVAFNSRQVQLDNEMLAYVDARFDATHRHYDAVLGIHGRHMGEIDERHLILQEELVAHVHDLIKRIDLVLAEAERGRTSLEFTLREVRARLEQLEKRLNRG